MKKKIKKWPYGLESIIMVIGIVIALIITSSSKVGAIDNKTIDGPPRTPGGFPKILDDDDDWPTQILYDTVGACFQGTVKWVVMNNPGLIGQIPSPMAQRQMVEHCFCVMDYIRKELKYQEYIKKVPDITWTGKLFMDNAAKCVGEYETLPSFFMKIPDNETTINPKELEDSKDELPSQKPKESKKDSTTIFQG